jgi:hypothetical protein
MEMTEVSSALSADVPTPPKKSGRPIDGEKDSRPRKKYRMTRKKIGDWGANVEGVRERRCIDEFSPRMLEIDRDQPFFLLR